MTEKYWKSKSVKNRVIRTTVKPKNGFYTIFGFKIGGYDKIQEGLIEDQYEVCSIDIYNEQKFLKEEKQYEQDNR